MFFGREIISEIPSPLSTNNSSYQTILISNVALSKSSQQAELYLKINDQQILICELNRSLGILQNSLNLLADLNDSPALISRNGNVHVCGYYQAVKTQSYSGERISAEVQTATNKKDNSLKSRFHKTQTLAPQNLSTHINANPKRSEQKNQTQNVIQQNFTPRQSSRLTSRRSASTNPEILKPVATIDEETKQRPSKKEQKSQKRSGQGQAILWNGRYNLKALLQNIDNDDDDDDSDDQQQEGFDLDGDEDESDDDIDSEEDEQEEEEQKPKKKTKQHDQSSNSKKKSKAQEQVKQRPRRQKFDTKAPIQIAQEQSSEKPQPNTEEFQQKWPENVQEHQLLQKSKAQEKIEQLASKLKIPTKRPTI